jgi:hypothetical protein
LTWTKSNPVKPANNVWVRPTLVRAHSGPAGSPRRHFMQSASCITGVVQPVGDVSGKRASLPPTSAATSVSTTGNRSWRRADGSYPLSIFCCSDCRTACIGFQKRQERVRVHRVDRRTYPCQCMRRRSSRPHQWYKRRLPWCSRCCRGAARVAPPVRDAAGVIDSTATFVRVSKSNLRCSQCTRPTLCGRARALVRRRRRTPPLEPHPASP